MEHHIEQRVKNLEEMCMGYKGQLEVLKDEVRMVWSEINAISNWISTRFGVDLTKEKSLSQRKMLHLLKRQLVQLSRRRSTRLRSSLRRFGPRWRSSGSINISSNSKSTDSDDVAVDFDSMGKACEESAKLSEVPHNIIHTKILTLEIDKCETKGLQVNTNEESIIPYDKTTKVEDSQKGHRSKYLPFISIQTSKGGTRTIFRSNETMPEENSALEEIKTKKEIKKFPHDKEDVQFLSSAPEIEILNTGHKISGKVLKRGRPKKLPEQKVQTPKVKTPMVCDECGKVLKGTASLRCHKQIHSNTRPYECHICKKAFRMKHHLDFHLMVHGGDKKWTCKFCNKGFLARRDLLRHERTHTGERPFACSYPDCTKSFNVKQHLTLHFRTHTGERPYKCPVCHKTFTQANSLRIHRKIHAKAPEEDTLVDKPRGGGDKHILDHKDLEANLNENLIITSTVQNVVY